MENDQHVIQIENYRFNKKKNEQVFYKRKISFYDLILALDTEKNILGLSLNHNYPNQLTLEILINGYPCSAPFIFEKKGTIFFKTLYQNRKLIKKYKLHL